MHLPYLLHNNGTKEIITIGAESMHTVLQLALKADPKPELKVDIERMIAAIEKALEPKDDSDWEWEH